MSSAIETGFIQSLPNITNKNTPAITTTIYGTSVVTSRVNTAINAYLTNAPPQGSSFSGYSRNLLGFLRALSDAGVPTNISTPTQSAIFTSVLGQLTSGPGSLSNPDLLLMNSIGASASTLTQSALDHFFANLTPVNLGANANNYYSQLQSYLASYLTKTTDILTTTAAFPSYQALFNAFIGGSVIDFQNSFKDFYNTMMNKYGYFLPSQMLPQWINQLNAKTNPTAIIDLGTGSSQTQIIFQLLALVSQMINTLQEVSTAQVQRLTFYANWQQAYTQLISKIPIVTFSDLKGKVKAPNDDQIITATQQIGNINQTYTQQAQGYRDSVTDESKSQQSAVDQSQQALQAQSSLATTLLQNLSTILQSIFQG